VEIGDPIVIRDDPDDIFARETTGYHSAGGIFSINGCGPIQDILMVLSEGRECLKGEASNPEKKHFGEFSRVHNCDFSVMFFFPVEDTTRGRGNHGVFPVEQMFA
jgi:hypothetical protein